MYIPYTKSYNYSKIYKLGDFNNFEIYASENSMCYDFQGICVNKPKENYNIKKIGGYIYITK